MAERNDNKTESAESSLLVSRVKEGIRKLSAYSVPHYHVEVKLDGNESPFHLPSDVASQVEKALSAVDVNRYPDPEALAVRDIISRTSHFPLDGILLGNGSDELIGMLIATFCGGSGSILIPVPTFSMFGITGTALGARVLESPLDGAFDIDFNPFLDIIEREDPDLIFLASPNNPTGNVYSEEKIGSVISRSRGIVVVDEAYSDFSGQTFLPDVKEHENLIILRTLSKVGFAGLRLGILYGREELAREINKVRYPYNINSLTQATAGVVLENHEFVNENIQLIVRERDRVYKALTGMEGVETYPSDANFILFKVGDADALFGGLIDRGVLIRNFNRPGRLENCMRVTIGTPDENDRFLSAVSEILAP